MLGPGNGCRFLSRGPKKGVRKWEILCVGGGGVKENGVMLEFM